MDTEPTTAPVLRVLTKARLDDLGREFGVAVPPSASKDEQVNQLCGAARLDLCELLPWLGREGLKAACRSHGLD